MQCERCRGLGFIRRADLRLDDIEPGQPVTATVMAVHGPEPCPDCNGSGRADCCSGASCETEDR